MIGQTLELNLIVYTDSLNKKYDPFNITYYQEGLGFSEIFTTITTRYLEITSYKLPTYTPASGTYEYTLTIPINDPF